MLRVKFLVFRVTVLCLLLRLMSSLMLLMVAMILVMFSKPWRVCRLVQGVRWMVLFRQVVVWLLL